MGFDPTESSTGPKSISVENAAFLAQLLLTL
jgi:hypothetical protein